MEIIAEITSLRVEQRRLRDSLNLLDARVDDLDRRWRCARSPKAVPEVPRSFAPVSSPPPLPAETAAGAFVQAPEPAIASMADPIPASPPVEAPPAPAVEPRESLELRLGRVWLVRIGIVILITGLVFLGNYAYHEFIARIGPVGKLILIYLVGGGLCALGAWIGRRQESLRTYGRVLLAGGCATIYYATYAAHFVAALRVIDSPILAGALLLGLGGAFVLLADRLRSQTLAAATIALSFYTAAINPAAEFSLFSNLVISAAAVVLLARRQWVSVSFLSLVAAYGSFAFWRLQQSGSLLPGNPPDAFWPAFLFPAAYWLVFTVAVMLRRVETFDPSARPVFLTLNNAAFFALAGPVVSGSHPDFFWLFAVLYGGFLVAFAAVVSRRRTDEPLFDGSFLAQGLGLVVLGLFYKLSDTGWQQAISFALLSGTLVALGRLRHGAVYRFFAGVCALVAAWVALEGIVETSPHARIVAACVAVIFTTTAWLLKKQSGFTPRCDWRVLGFAFLAGGLYFPACADADLVASAWRILGIALIAMLSLRLLRLPEIAYAAQPLALAGQCLLLIHAAMHSVSAGAVLMSAAFGLAFVHLWQWRAHFLLTGRRTAQALHCVAPIVLTLWWSLAQLPEVERGPALALIALVLLAYGSVTKIGTLALASTPLTFVAFGVTAGAIFDRLPWMSPALAAMLLAAQSLVLPRIPWRSILAPTLRAAALALIVAMIFAYVPADARFLVLLFAALGFFAGACIRRSGETMTYAALLGSVAASFWIGRLFDAPAQWTDFIGFTVAVAAQRLGKRSLAETGWFGAEVQTILCSAIVCGVWILLHRLMASTESGFLLTVSWSLLALVVLGGGFALRERTYRLLGLVILTAAVGRIFCVDVWQLETLFRILSFLVLGAVLLALGFLYNRHAEALRRWL